MEMEKPYREEWKQKIAGMSLEELMKTVVEEPGVYYPEFIRMARQKLFNDYRMIKRLQSNEEKQKRDEAQKAGYDPMKRVLVRELLEHVLDELGCQYVEENEDEICIHYEGEKFFVYPVDYEQFVTIYSWWVEMCDLDDKEYIAKLKKSINQTNQTEYATFFYAEDEEPNTFAVRGCRTIYFGPELNDIANHLRYAFECIFKAWRFLELEMERYWKEEREEQKTTKL